MVLPPGSAPWGETELSKCPVSKSRFWGQLALLLEDSKRWMSPSPHLTSKCLPRPESYTGRGEALSQSQAGDQQTGVPVETLPPHH